MGKWMNGFLDKLTVCQQANLLGGGEIRMKIQKELGKLTARERIDSLVDAGSFKELGSLVRDFDPLFTNTKPTPADGVVMGTAKIANRSVMLYSMDYTVMSGSLGDQAAWKIAELVEMAGQNNIPLIGIIDSLGERIKFKDGSVGLDGVAHLIKNYCKYSGIIPRITLLLGPCTGLMAQIPVLSDFLIMNKKTGFLWLGGEIVSKKSGKPEFHMEKSGQCDILADDDFDAIEKTKELFAFLPQNCWEKNSVIKCDDDPKRSEEALLDIMPDNPKMTYDSHEIIELITDNGDFFELKEEYAPNIITGFCRFDGIVVGIVASNPDELGGIMEPNSSDKYDRFINFLDAFSIPLLTLVDTTAFPPGDKWERLGVIRHGAKNLHSYANLTCPKITIVLRRAYGGSNIVLGCAKMNPDFIFGWPSAEFAPTGPETIVHAIFHKELAKAKEEGRFDEVFNMYLSPIKEYFSVLTMGTVFTTYYTVHEVIDPRKTRLRVIDALHATLNKKEILPERKRFIKPA